MQVKVGLCGQQACYHICTRVQYCRLGLELSYRRLRAQRVRREQRANLRVVVGQLEVNIQRNAGSFEAFSRELAREGQRKGKEVVCAQQQWR